MLPLVNVKGYEEKLPKKCLKKKKNQCLCYGDGTCQAKCVGAFSVSVSHYQPRLSFVIIGPATASALAASCQRRDRPTTWLSSIGGGAGESGGGGDGGNAPPSTANTRPNVVEENCEGIQHLMKAPK